MEALRSDAQLSKAKVLKPHGGPVDLKFHVLDVSEEKSIDVFVEFLKKEHGEIDVVVNNAGIAMDGFGECGLHSNRTCLEARTCV